MFDEFNSIKVISNINLLNEDVEGFNYSNSLTKKLDSINSDFNQDIINEIVLWKVNRFAKIDEDILMLINQIDKNSTKLNEALTRNILQKLLAKESKGIRLAMASTILRFKNPNIYQIIDQRVYRIIYSTELKLPLSFSTESIEEQITLYIKYLMDLRRVCSDKQIEFSSADRILYMVDKRVNKNISLNNYSNNKR